MNELLRVEELRIALPGPEGERVLLEELNFGVEPERCVALVGESGCGKSLCARALLGFHPEGARVSGAIRLEVDGSLGTAGGPELPWSRIRGAEIGLVFQDPAASLNPVARVGAQLELLLRKGAGLDRRDARRRALELLEEVRLDDPQRVARSLPSELSGGMQQRVALALALAQKPRLLIADEPTTALDVTLRREILELFRDLCQRRGMALLLISHDLGVVAELADAVNVLYAGRIVERQQAGALFRAPRHPYTRGLLDALPRLGEGKGKLRGIPGRVPPPGPERTACAFAPRCALAEERCRREGPPLAGDPPVACWKPLS